MNRFAVLFLVCLILWVLLLGYSVKEIVEHGPALIGQFAAQVQTAYNKTIAH